MRGLEGSREGGREPSGRWVEGIGARETGLRVVGAFARVVGVRVAEGVTGLRVAGAAGRWAVGTAGRRVGGAAGREPVLRVVGAAVRVLGRRLVGAAVREPGLRVVGAAVRVLGRRLVGAAVREPGLRLAGAAVREPGLRLAGAAVREPGLREATAGAREEGLRLVVTAAREPGLRVPATVAREPGLRVPATVAREPGLREATAGAREEGLRVVVGVAREPGLREAAAGRSMVRDGLDPAVCGRSRRASPPGPGPDRPLAGFAARAATRFRAGAEGAGARDPSSLPVPRAPGARGRAGPVVAALGVEARDPAARPPVGRPPAMTPLPGLAAGREADRERAPSGGAERDLGVADAFATGDSPRGTEPRDAGEGLLGALPVAAFSATVRRCGPRRSAATGLELAGARGGVLRGAAPPRDPFLLAPVVFVGIMPPSRPGLGTGPLNRSAGRCAPQGNNGRGSTRRRGSWRRPDGARAQPGGCPSSACSSRSLAATDSSRSGPSGPGVASSSPISRRVRPRIAAR